MASSSVWLSVW